MRIMCILLFFNTLFASCVNKTTGDGKEDGVGEVNVYTHRHYEVDKELFESFTNQTGIKVNVVSASADELITKLEIEGADSPADILITVDAGRLHLAKSRDLLQAIELTETISNNVPPLYRDPENYWIAITYRARIIAYAKDKIQSGEIENYEDLIQSKWKSKVLMRSSDNIYNQSLLASFIVHKAESGAAEWARGMVNNFAREPKGNDRSQVKDIHSGAGDVSILNTYYLGQMLNSEDPAEKEAAQSIGIVFPNQNNRGTHINVSGLALTKYAPNKENAIRLIEFLTSEEAQMKLADSNYEYPVKAGIPWNAILQEWGDFKKDSLSFDQLGLNNRKAVEIFDQVKWK
jgi:iron(III) transport system substrate-binding protein